MGVGRMLLLEKINKSGSISEAAKKMKMSYKKAWELVDGMNNESKKPLVIRVSGGKGGGGTIVTKEGMAALKQFKKILTDFHKFCDKKTKVLK